MKKFLFPLIIGIACIGCQQNTPSEASTDAPAQEKALKASSKFVKDARNIGPAKPKAQFAIEEAHSKITNKDRNQMIGYWVGQFGQNKINIALTEIKDGTAIGHSICAGNYRLITGTEKELGPNRFEYNLNEPGDDQYDGNFEFTIDLEAGTLSGKWTPFKAESNKAKTYTLSKKEVVYNENNGEYTQASKKLLTEEDVENMDAYDLKLMRNEIYARHGYSFKNKEIRKHFEQFDWYIPTSVDVRENLKDIEVKNIALIYEYETYYEEYYDDFGR